MSAAVTPLRRPVTERYLSPDQVCELVPGLTVQQLAERRKKRLEPDYFKPTGGADSRGTVVYAESDIRAWIEAGRIRTRKSAS